MTLTWTDPSGVDHEVTPRERFRLTVTEDGTADCFLAQFSDEPCDGLVRACHLIPGRKIRSHFPLGAWRWPGKPWTPTLRSDVLHDGLEILTVDELVYDPRIGVAGCGGPMGLSGHHGALDTARTLKIPREALPEGVTQFAEAFGLSWFLEIGYPLSDTEAPHA